ncbi:MAG: nucleotidyl transferase AbiEii/AbiGii toxin family protein [Nitrososphaerota archaeon]|nr:nucleotidyl transferase AbiEii/AbiGii toxin family protein [Nitrososphaerota archaeon]MDG6932422.1 nucleotidyl transferase AbiEii/AbiGii toxin family protein [Nitrososphaerota archaeon]
MLNEKEIFELSGLRKLKPWQEEKRYIQSLVIYALSNEELTMKGGTYLWLFHGLNRFSEDLDFTLDGVLKDPESQVSKALKLFGVNSSITTIKDDRHTLTFRVNALGPLFSTTKTTCYVYVEISRREKPVLEPDVIKLDEPLYGMPVAFLNGMKLEEVAAEKVRAIITRSSSRDLYDLWFLMHRLNVKLDASLIQSKLSFYNTTYQNFREKVEQNRGIWRRELEPVIFGKIPDFDQVAGEALQKLVL